MGPYNVGYRWAPYMDPIAVAMIHALSVVFWVHLFWHLFYDGDHHLPLMASVQMPVFDMQMRTLFLNEELGNLKDKIKTILESDFVKTNRDIEEKTTMVLEKLESFKNSGIDDNLIVDILRVQNLVSEIEKDGD